jgi:carbon storage regulator CsrA
MLVLSRGRNDKVVFPTLGITVEILRIFGNKVRLGIEAPQDVAVLRNELVGSDRTHAQTANDRSAGDCGTHSVRNRLQKATLGLRLLQRMLEAGQADDTEPAIFRIFNELKSLEEELCGTGLSPARTTSEKGRRALIVEDDVNESELLAGYLRLSGFEVRTAVDGLQAMVHLSASDRPDVVLLDMKMPRFDGRQTVSAIRQNSDYQALKIFAVTGTDQSEADVTVGPEGVDRWFRKPVDPELLVDAIHRELVAEITAA